MAQTDEKKSSSRICASEVTDGPDMVCIGKPPTYLEVLESRMEYHLEEVNRLRKAIKILKTDPSLEEKIKVFRNF